MRLLLSYSLTTTLIPTFGYIKWGPYVVFTDSVLDITFGQYVRQGMGKKKIPPKTWDEFVVAIFCSEISPMVSCP